MSKINKQRGATSIFIVVFFTLLIVVLTIGFIRIMIQEQQAASNNDLSQSAYDSAMAGVEDAKRAIRACEQNPGGRACLAIENNQCNTIQDAGIVSTGGSETKIRSNNSSGDEEDYLNQAYTCVKVQMDTVDYMANLSEGRSVVLPLRAEQEFSYILIEWAHKDQSAGNNAYLGGDSEELVKPTDTGTNTLPEKDAWKKDAPSLLRIQSVLPKDANTIPRSDLDGSAVSTFFLRPSSVSGAPDSAPFTISPTPRAAATDTNTPTQPIAIVCSNERYTAGEYACRALIDIKDVDGGKYNIPAMSNLAMLRLTSLYRDTSVRVSLRKSADLSDPGVVVKFSGVQPLVDSTGRASNVFRRVASRLEIGGKDFPYPENAVDVTGSFCKNFYITDKASDAGEDFPECDT